MSGAALSSSISLKDLCSRRKADSRGFMLTVTSLVLRSGDMIAILGPSGSGKSTLIELLGLALKPDAGRYELTATDGELIDLAACWRSGDYETLARMRASYFGYVPQTGALLPFLDVRRNIEVPQRLSGRLDAARTNEIAAALGIDDVMRRLPGTLSVGQRQRVAIARAIAHRPAFVLADEPTAALDPGNARIVATLLVDLARRNGTGLVVVTHDLALAREFQLTCLQLSWGVQDGQWQSAVPVYEGATV